MERGGKLLDLFLLLCFLFAAVLLILTAHQVSTVPVELSEPVPCLVIDPGHGGVDGGAIAFNGVKESDINLPELDSLVFKSSVGSFIEPFLYENVKWYFGKVFGAANRPDSVLVATIELPFKTAQYKEAPYLKADMIFLSRNGFRSPAPIHPGVICQ